MAAKFTSKTPDADISGAEDSLTTSISASSSEYEETEDETSEPVETFFDLLARTQPANPHPNEYGPGTVSDLSTDLPSFTAELDAADNALKQAERLQSPFYRPPLEPPVIPDFVEIGVEALKRLAKLNRTFSKIMIEVDKNGGNMDGLFLFPPPGYKYRPGTALESSLATSKTPKKQALLTPKLSKATVPSKKARPNLPNTKKPVPTPVTTSPGNRVPTASNLPTILKPAEAPPLATNAKRFTLTKPSSLSRQLVLGPNAENDAPATSDSKNALLIDSPSPAKSSSARIAKPQSVMSGIRTLRSVNSLKLKDSVVSTGSMRKNSHVKFAEPIALAQDETIVNSSQDVMVTPTPVNSIAGGNQAESASSKTPSDFRLVKKESVSRLRTARSSASGGRPRWVHTSSNLAAMPASSTLISKQSVATTSKVGTFKPVQSSRAKEEPIPSTSKAGTAKPVPSSLAKEEPVPSTSKAATAKPVESSLAKEEPVPSTSKAGTLKPVHFNPADNQGVPTGSTAAAATQTQPVKKTPRRRSRTALSSVAAGHKPVAGTSKVGPSSLPKPKSKSGGKKKGKAKVKKPKKSAKASPEPEILNPLALFPMLTKDYFLPNFKFSKEAVDSYLRQYPIGEHSKPSTSAAPQENEAEVRYPIYYKYPTKMQWNSDGTPRPYRISELTPYDPPEYKRKAWSAVAQSSSSEDAEGTHVPGPVNATRTPLTLHTLQNQERPGTSPRLFETKPNSGHPTRPTTAIRSLKSALSNPVPSASGVKPLPDSKAQGQ